MINNDSTARGFFMGTAAGWLLGPATGDNKTGGSIIAGGGSHRRSLQPAVRLNEIFGTFLIVFGDKNKDEHTQQTFSSSNSCRLSFNDRSTRGLQTASSSAKDARGLMA